MAVVRIVFPDKGAVKSVAAVAKENDLPKVEQEIMRIVKKERPGMAAELSAEEAVALGELVESCPPRVRATLAAAAENARELIEYDRSELERRRAQGDRIRNRVQTGQ